MTIQVGQELPPAKLIYSANPGDKNSCAVPQVLDPGFFKGKTVVLFAVPGAFTPGCHLQHLPGFVEHYQSFKQKGVDAIICLATNDVFVMDAWGKQHNAADKVLMVSDGNGDFVTSLGLDQDLSKNSMGKRSKRFAMIVKDGIVKDLTVGDIPVTNAESVLSKL
ncbi:Redoxin [Gorgonomyces haynaldii]|nr:Redoxin [Gorgonomyces haynaldii]